MYRTVFESGDKSLRPENGSREPRPGVHADRPIEIAPPPKKKVCKRGRRVCYTIDSEMKHTVRGQLHRYLLIKKMQLIFGLLIEQGRISYEHVRTHSSGVRTPAKNNVSVDQWRNGEDRDVK